MIRAMNTAPPHTPDFSELVLSDRLIALAEDAGRRARGLTWRAAWPGLTAATKGRWVGVPLAAVDREDVYHIAIARNQALRGEL